MNHNISGGYYDEKDNEESRYQARVETNSWNFTRLGKIDGVTKGELKKILGKGNMTAVHSELKTTRFYGTGGMNPHNPFGVFFCKFLKF